MSSHYNPDQPRFPVGHQYGGRWTYGGSADHRTPNSSLFDRRSSIDAALGLREGDKREGYVQLAFLDEQKPPIWQPPSKPLPGVFAEPKFPFPLGSLGPIGRAIALFSLLSQFNDDQQQAIIAFRSREFRRRNNNIFDLEGVRVLSREEVEDICGDQFKNIQKLVDDTFDDVKHTHNHPSEHELGTAVHKKLEDAIKSKKEYKDLEVERTYEKIPPSDSTKKEKYGAKGSIRVDVRNKVNADTICVDEIKTGYSRLTFTRMQEIVRRESARNPKVTRIVITEVVPKNARLPKPRPPTLQSE